MARATSSLPTPLSPRMSTVTSLSDTCSMTDAIVAISGLSPQKRNARSWSSDQLPPQLADLRDQPAFLDGALDRRIERDLAEPLGIVRLDDVVGRAQPHGLDDRRRLLAPGEHDHLQVGFGGLERPQRLEPVHPGHHHVEQHDVRRVALLDGRQHFVAAREGARLVPAQREKRLQVPRECRIVVDDGDVGFLQRHHSSRGTDTTMAPRDAGSASPASGDQTRPP